MNVEDRIVGDFFIVPFFLPGSLDGLFCRHFIENDLPVLLNDDPFLLCGEIRFMHDDSRTHFSILAR